MSEPTVRVTGIVLASLMFQHLNSDSDVEGLILGECKSEEHITISDSQSDHVHIEEVYNIQKHVACLKLNSLYNGVGEVNQDAIKKMVSVNKQGSVIGWYRQRRNMDQQMAFREKIVHENLKTALSNPHMIFLLLTPSELASLGSTHRVEFAAFISHRRRFINVPVLVNNLGLLEQFSYWTVSAPCSAPGYNLAMKTCGSRFFRSTGSLKEVDDIGKMNDYLQTELQKVCRKVEASERQVETLQKNVSALRKRVAEKRRHGTGVDTAVLPPEPTRSMQLHTALQAMFACSPLLQTQAFTLQAVPVRDVLQTQAFTLQAVPVLEVLRH